MASHGRGRHYGTRQTLQGTYFRGFSVRSSPSTVGAEGTLQHVKQLPGNLSRKGFLPLRGQGRAGTCAGIFLSSCILETLRGPSHGPCPMPLCPRWTPACHRPQRRGRERGRGL
jgi:hypothetical protein